jgi:hypothetical protein
MQTRYGAHIIFKVAELTAWVQPYNIRIPSPVRHAETWRYTTEGICPFSQNCKNIPSIEDPSSIQSTLTYIHLIQVNIIVACRDMT